MSLTQARSSNFSAKFQFRIKLERIQPLFRRLYQPLAVGHKSQERSGRRSDRVYTSQEITNQIGGHYGLPKRWHERFASVRFGSTHPTTARGVPVARGRGAVSSRRGTAPQCPARL